MKNKVVGIIGFGRFGKVLHRLFSDEFEILVSSASYSAGDLKEVTFATFEETIRRSDALFLSVPINKIAETAARIRPYLRLGQLVVDVCSVKEMPFHKLKETLKDTGAHIWPTHPMFGPDSAKNGFEGLTWVSCDDNLHADVIEPYVTYLKRKGLTVFHTTCEMHDRIAASTQGLTHLIGRYLNELSLAPSPIDTLGYKRLCAVRDQTCNDTWELFYDLMRYNRFSREIQQNLENAVCAVSSQLTDEAAKRKDVRIGFSGMTDAEQQSILRELKTMEILRTEKLDDRPMTSCAFDTALQNLFHLSTGKLDLTALCLQTADGAMSLDTLAAMGNYHFRVIGEYKVPTRDGEEFKRFILVTRRRWTSVK